MNQVDYKKAEDNELELFILRDFFDSIVAARPIDKSISDSKMIGVTKRKLKAATKDAIAKCTCSRRTFGGPCELCQASSKELYYLRSFFRVIRDAKKHDMTTQGIQEFIETIKKLALI